MQWPSNQGGNDHYYGVVSVSEGVKWSQADQEAKQLGGYLATVTSDPENNFIFSLIDDPSLWTREENRNFGPWIGGLKAGNAWEWVNGEPFSYTNWYDGEPNNEHGGIEDRIQYFSGPTQNPETSRFWNDEYGEFEFFEPRAYVVELDQAPTSSVR